jgi:hypothetical protein
MRRANVNIKDKTQMTIRPMVAGNWKMNGLSASLDEANSLAAELGNATYK